VISRTQGSNKIFDVTPDGQKFLVGISSHDSAPSRVTVVLNWTAALAR
jgi:hypothetical protein